MKSMGDPEEVRQSPKSGGRRTDVPGAVVNAPFSKRLFRVHYDPVVSRESNDAIGECASPLLDDA
jgi:hypothetical protein